VPQAQPEAQQVGAEATILYYNNIQQTGSCIESLHTLLKHKFFSTSFCLFNPPRHKHDHFPTTMLQPRRARRLAYFRRSVFAALVFGVFLFGSECAAFSHGPERFDLVLDATMGIAYERPRANHPQGKLFTDPPAPFNSRGASEGLRAQVDEGTAVAPVRLTVSAGPIVVNLTCKHTDAARCARMAAALQQTARVYAALLDLRRPLTVAAEFKSFCADPPTIIGLTAFGASSGIGSKECPLRLRTALGSALPSAQWTIFGVKDVDPRYSYPQALAKQLSVRDLEWAPSDVTATFNVDADLWFEVRHIYFSLMVQPSVHLLRNTGRRADSIIANRCHVSLCS
jgi:hypothetical protein